MPVKLKPLGRIVGPLLSWYEKNRRVLPWREDPQPYHVWLSEIMLQQTRVETVKPYYSRFLEALPSVKDLAAAPEEQLLKLWQGLGYYSRVRTMQKAARILHEQYDDCLPSSYEELIRLPGFGEYTAGAVASIAFDIPVPAVDGNVLRVYSRLEASFDDIMRPEVRKEVTRRIAEIEPSDRPGDFNQSLMELGATVCLPNGAPKCMVCPLNGYCEGYRQGVAEELPKKAPKAKRKIENRTILLLTDGEKVALQKRPDSGLLAAMWEFPNLPDCQSRQAVLAILEGKQAEVLSIKPLKPAKHIFSHIEWHMSGWLVHISKTASLPEFSWATAKELLREYALPSAYRTFLKAAENILSKSSESNCL